MSQPEETAGSTPAGTSVTLTHAPARTSAIVAVVAGVVAVIAGGLSSILGLLFGVLGLALLIASVTTLALRAGVTVGVGILYVGVIAGGVFGAPTELLLIATIAAIVAWDAGQNAVTIGNQLGRSARTERAEVLHVGATVGVGICAAAVAYAASLASTGGLPAAAVVFLLLALSLLAWSIRA